MGDCVVLVGATASGKTTLAKELETRGYRRIITYTTRGPRPGEVHDVDYHFISDYEFKLRMQDNFFAETTVQRSGGGNYYYGSPRKEYTPEDNTVIVLNPEGVINLREKAFIVFLDLPDETLVRRALNRGDNYNDVFRRLLDERLYLTEMNSMVVPDLCIQSEIPTDRIIEYIEALLSVKNRKNCILYSERDIENLL